MKKGIIYPSSRMIKAGSMTQFPASHFSLLGSCDQILSSGLNEDDELVLLKQHKRQNVGFFFFWLFLVGKLLLKVKTKCGNERMKEVIFHRQQWEMESECPMGSMHFHLKPIKDL